MSKPRLSICVPLFAGCSFRVRNWRVIANELSVLAERRGDIEIVAAEHGFRYAEGYPFIRRVDVPTFTRSSARNAGWTAAAADRICFCDSDMLMAPDAWDKAIEDSQDVDCYNPSAQFWKPGAKQTANRITTDNRYRFDLPLRGTGLKPRRANLTGGIFFTTREFLDRAGGWDERFRGWGYEDTALGIVARRIGASIRTGITVGRPVHLWHPARKVLKGTGHVLRKHYLKPSAKRPTEVIQPIDLYATHLPTLAAMARQVKPGEVVFEFGAGPHSTPLLSALADEVGFDLHSYEQHAQYDAKASVRVHPHRLSYDSIDQDIEFAKSLKPSLVFVDTGYLGRDTCRGWIVRELLPHAKWIVAHDTEDRFSHVYKYDFGLAKFVQHFTTAGVRTTVASQFERISLIPN